MADSALARRRVESTVYLVVPPASVAEQPVGVRVRGQDKAVLLGDEQTARLVRDTNRIRRNRLSALVEGIRLLGGREEYGLSMLDSRAVLHLTVGGGDSRPRSVFILLDRRDVRQGRSPLLAEAAASALQAAGWEYDEAGIDLILRRHHRRLKRGVKGG